MRSSCRLPSHDLLFTLRQELASNAAGEVWSAWGRLQQILHRQATGRATSQAARTTTPQNLGLHTTLRCRLLLLERSTTPRPRLFATRELSTAAPAPACRGKVG